MHENTLLLFDRYARPYFRPGTKVLEVGPDFPSTLRRQTADECIQWHTVDIFKDPQLTYAAVDEYSFPIPEQRL
jgi:hypothetical protein